jgi:hypothetical protein
MTKLVNHPRHWRRRAAEARTAADAEKNPDLKHKLLRLAKNYEEVAERAEARAKAASSRL